MMILPSYRHHSNLKRLRVNKKPQRVVGAFLSGCRAETAEHRAMKTGRYPRGKTFLRRFTNPFQSAVDPGNAGFDDLSGLRFSNTVLPSNSEGRPFSAEV